MVERSKHFFGDILDEECFTQEAYVSRRMDAQKTEEIDDVIADILTKYENNAMQYDCQWL